MADGKNSKDTPDQTAGSDENTTETTEVSSSSDPVAPPVGAASGPWKPAETTPESERDASSASASGPDDAPHPAQDDALDSDPAVMPGGDASATDAGLKGTATPPETEAATNEGFANPPETEVAPAPDDDRDSLGATPQDDVSGDREPAAGATPPPVARETVVERKGGFFPMVIGGALAAVIGYGYGQYESGDWPFGPGTDDPFRSQTTAALDQQRAQIDDISSRLGNTETAVGAFDVSELTGAVADLDGATEDLRSQISGLSDQIGQLEVRVVELEKRPMEAALSPEAVAAYEREMDSLRADIESQRNEIQNFAAEAVAAEQDTQVQAELARARAALAELTAALENGQPFDAQVDVIGASGVAQVPPALSGIAADGVPTLAALVTEYPDAARAGLAAARSEAAPAEGTNHVLNFLRDQVGARSVTPRDGADADAVLSRAEAALNSGNVAGALSEIETLSDAAQSAMGDWIAPARQRVAAQDAAQTLAQELNQE